MDAVQQVIYDQPYNRNTAPGTKASHRQTKQNVSFHLKNGLVGADI